MTKDDMTKEESEIYTDIMTWLSENPEALDRAKDFTPALNADEVARDTLENAHIKLQEMEGCDFTLRDSVDSILETY